MSALQRFKSYPAYKDSGVEWLGKIPAHWGVTKVQHSTYVKGRIGWQNLRNEEFVEEGPYCVTGSDFRDGRVDWGSCYHVTALRYEQDPYIQLRQGDLLITKDGSIGKLALVEKLPGPACLNSGVFVTRPLNGTYESTFLYHVLSSSVFASFIDYMSAGSTIQHLYQYVFETFAFPTPGIDEQRAIAAFLDCETAKIDALVAKKERLIELLQEKRTALITRAVTKGLDPSVPMKESGVEWLGEIPAHWEVGALRRFWSVVACKHRTADYVIDGIPIVSTTEVKPGRLCLEGPRRVTESDYLDLVQGGRRPSYGDIIYSRNASLGSAAYVQTAEPFCMGQDVCLITSKGDQLYLMYQLNCQVVLDQIEATSVGSTFDRINVSQIKEFQVVRPPEAEQREIAAFLDKQTSKMDSLVARVRKAIDHLCELRTALISAAVTGKIDVRAASQEAGAA